MASYCSSQKGCLISCLNFINPLPPRDHPLVYVQSDDQSWAHWKESWFLILLFHFEISGTRLVRSSFCCYYFECMGWSRWRCLWYFGNNLADYYCFAMFSNWLGILKNCAINLRYSVISYHTFLQSLPTSPTFLATFKLSWVAKISDLSLLRVLDRHLPPLYTNYLISALFLTIIN